MTSAFGTTLTLLRWMGSAEGGLGHGHAHLSLALAVAFSGSRWCTQEF